MKDVTVIRNGREYSALETRNIVAGNLASKRYDQYRIRVKHDGIMSKFYVKPYSYWDTAIYAGCFIYDINTDKITWFFWSDYHPSLIFVVVPLVNVLDDDDKVIVSIKRGRIIDRYRINIRDLKMLIGCGESKYGLYPVNKTGFEKLKSKVYKGSYAKR